MHQVKPLLQVTRQDEEIQVRESQLLKAKENLSQVELSYAELDKKHAQVTGQFSSPPPPPPPPTPLSVVFSLTSAALRLSSAADGGEVGAGGPAAGRGRAVC